MSNPEPGTHSQAAALTPLPSIDDLPRTKDGAYEADAVREAFDAFRRHTLQLQAQLRVLQAAGRTANVDPTGHAVRMDALHLIRAAAEFADILERDAQAASAAQIARAEEEIRRGQRDLQGREAEVERHRAEMEKQTNEALASARNEAREIRAKAERDAAAELREAEARGARLIEQARHQATDLTNAARAEVEQTLDWARAHASAVIGRAQEAAEELLGAAGLGGDAIKNVSAAIMQAARSNLPPGAPGAAEPHSTPATEAPAESSSERTSPDDSNA